MNCLCGTLGAFEALSEWQIRVGPVLSRLVKHGHRIDSRRIQKVAILVTGHEQGNPASTALTNNHHSHHMLWCPARIGGARMKMPLLHKVASIARK